MSNLYKGHYPFVGQESYRVINSNELLARKLEALRNPAEGEQELTPKEPEISLEQIRQEADSILKSAELQASQLMEETRQRVVQLEEAARARGEQAGYEAGQKKALLEAEIAQNQQEEQRRRLEEEYLKLREALEPQVLAAVCEVFEKVFDIQFDQHREMLLYLVKQAILKIESSKEFQIRVSEKNYQYLEAHKNEVLSQVGQNIRLDMEADASLDETQCVIETDSGFFECGIHVQFENLIKAIRSLSV